MSAGRGGGGSRGGGSFSLTPQRLPYPQTTLSGGLFPMRSHHHCFITNPTGSEAFAPPVSPLPPTALCRATRLGINSCNSTPPHPRVQTRQKRSREGNGFAQGHTASMWSSRAGPMLPNPCPAPSTVPCPPPYPVQCRARGTGKDRIRRSSGSGPAQLSR